ncbi:CbtB-domain containing protein [Flexivirga sp. ID2601S]|uniref:CbtB-domain containing protein n=1 Tax=Flexivirga aerilata TaxID=1656889 RepID=A0A849AJ79_9MICO|nr:CbtB domain-containing protein [Flexivirga aerilata]NNG40429.1 CbtB-domain containing protein [Flexivirga aerilata]
MSTVSVESRQRPATQVSTYTLSQAGRIALLAFTVFAALVVYYFIGVDQGMTSVFGKSTGIHEWMHDSRHFLGFPCH